MCNGKVFITERLASVSHTSMRRIEFSPFMALTNAKAACWKTSSPAISDSLFKTWQAKMRANWERLEATHSKFMSHQTNHLCCGRSIHTIATENVRTQQCTPWPPGRVSLLVLFLFLNVFFNYGWSNALETYALEPVRKTCSTFDRSGTLNIGIVRLECVHCMFPGA